MHEHQITPDRGFAHKAQYRITLASDADSRAPGGAVLAHPTMRQMGALAIYPGG